MFTVKQLSETAGVTSRTLRYYDEIGLLKPSRVGDNGYRYYDDEALLRLQQILLYRELGMPLERYQEDYGTSWASPWPYFLGKYLTLFMVSKSES